MKSPYPRWQFNLHLALFGVLLFCALLVIAAHAWPTMILLATFAWLLGLHVRRKTRELERATDEELRRR